MNSAQARFWAGLGFCLAGVACGSDPDAAVDSTTSNPAVAASGSVANENVEISWAEFVPEDSVIPSERRAFEAGSDQSSISELVERFRADLTKREKGGWESLAGALYGAVQESVSSGQIEALDAATLHEAFLYPRDPALANERFQGRLVVLSGLVTPDNMDDLPDLYKVYEDEPYAHFPLLLETNYEFNFVKCHLVEPRAQTLFDWQDVEIVGKVRGKEGLHIILDNCVVVSAKRERQGDPRPSFFVRDSKKQ